MKFWDTSAVLPLLVSEPATSAMEKIAREDPSMLVWWATEIECISALSRLERAGVDSEAIKPAFEGLDILIGSWHEVQPAHSIRQTARRILRVHDLRAADAFQLAAAIEAAGDASLEFVCLDTRLRRAAEREGLTAV